MIYLGCFVWLRLHWHIIMAHTAVAATIYPLLLSIYALYGEEGTSRQNSAKASLLEWPM